jgi:DNA-binding NarL/FixJ family response regulator
VVVVAAEAMATARLESALRALAGWRIVVAGPSQLLETWTEHPRAIVAAALADAATRRLLRDLRAWPRAPDVVALCDDPSTLWTPAARALGLRAALPRAATAEEIRAAVQAVHAGLLVVHPDTLAPAGARAAGPATAPLTAREREIVELLADGASNRAIASRLAISRHTAKFHVASILAKLGARSRAEAVAVALRRGWLAV